MFCYPGSITMTSQGAPWRLKSPASGLFSQPFVQAHIKENIKAPCHWPKWGNPPVTCGFPSQRASNGEMFPFDDVIARLIYEKYEIIRIQDIE